MPTLAAKPVCESLARVLVTSPNGEFRSRVAEKLLSESCVVEEATGGAGTLQRLEVEFFPTLLLDRHLTDLQAEEVAMILRRRCPQMRIVLVDSELEPSTPDSALLFDTLSEIGKSREAEVDAETQTVLPPPKSAAAPTVADPPPAEPLPGMLGTHPSIQRIFRMARLVAPRNTTVLITGETGTGKELVATAIHQISPRRNGPFFFESVSDPFEMAHITSGFAHQVRAKRVDVSPCDRFAWVRFHSAARSHSTDTTRDLVFQLPVAK
jgi:DNA-binding NtrC family response regulator